MVAHIGDYPLASELMASQATILPLYTLRAECRQCMDWEASVGCYLAICRVGGGVTQLPQAGEAKMLLQGHFSVLDPSMLQSDLSMLLPWQTGGHPNAM